MVIRLGRFGEWTLGNRLSTTPTLGPEHFSVSGPLTTYYKATIKPAQDDVFILPQPSQRRTETRKEVDLSPEYGSCFLRLLYPIHFYSVIIDASNLFYIQKGFVSFH